MKSRPILFSAPMVRAILEGRKTQTRRAAKLNASGRVALSGKNWHCADPDASLACPYGQPGDQLWVKETFRVGAKHDSLPPRSLPFDRGMSIAYAAGGMMCRDEVGGPYVSHPDDDLYESGWMGKTRVSIHMPRQASRITLEITSVRVERLQDISEADAQAEGAKHNGECDHIRHSCAEIGCFGPNSYRGGYAELWDRINGAGSWAANPWVWCVEFKRIEN